MAATIRIKRSNAQAAPTSLQEGELAYSFLSKKLFIGKADNTPEPVGGEGHFAPLASPAFTGSPTAPTPPNGDNSTRLATTAFVQSSLSGAGGGDMLKATYDANNDGKVDLAEDSEKLGGVAAAAYALLNSPAFTGVPTAPTAAQGTNTTQLATTAFVQAAIAALVNAAPGALDTLNELAAALGNDPNFATTVTNGLAGKLSKASNLSDLTDPVAARASLGLASMALQAASNVNITGGSIDGVTLDGGTF